MTREEAIKRLEWLRMVENHVDSVTLGKEDMPYFDMAISALREQPRWISVEERRPAYREKVLFVTKAGEVSFAKDSVDWDDGSVSFWDVATDIWVKGTHWMPLPEPPKEEV